MDNRDLFNHRFLHELREWQGSNALLLLIDGSLAFGSIGDYDDGYLVVLPPFNIAGTASAVYRPPASPAVQDITAQEIWVCGDDIAAAFTGSFTAPPFALSPAPVAVVTFNARAFVQYEVHEHFILELVEHLEELEGQNVILRSLGSWQVDGRVGEVAECVVWLGPSTVNRLPLLADGAICIFGSAIPEGVVVQGVFRGLINIVALISIG